MICKKCGRSLLPEVRFCTGCGTPVASTTRIDPPVSDRHEPETSPPVPPQPSRHVQQDSASRSQSNLGSLLKMILERKALLALIVVFILATIFTIKWIGYKKAQDDKGETVPVRSEKYWFGEGDSAIYLKWGASSQEVMGKINSQDFNEQDVGTDVGAFHIIQNYFFELEGNTYNMGYVFVQDRLIKVSLTSGIESTYNDYEHIIDVLTEKFGEPHEGTWPDTIEWSVDDTTVVIDCLGETPSCDMYKITFQPSE